MRAKLFILALLLILYLGIHGPFLFPKTVGKLEGTDVFIGDFTYYVDGAISIFQTNPYEKFNNKHQPIIPSKPVPPGALPAGSAVVAALYPFPSFKFGYSLTAAAITWPFDHALFERSIPRMAATNDVLGALVLVLIFLTLEVLFGNLIVPSTAVLFYVLDVFNIHNNYSYQSHTLAGLFYTLLAYYLFVRKKETSPLQFFVISNLLVFSVLTSSHTVLLSMTLGLLMSVRIFLDKKNWKDRYTYGLAGLLGVLMWPGYIRFVEVFVGFKKLGMPRYHEQFVNYGHTISNLVDSFPLFQRQIWDLRIWNPFIWIIVALLAVYYFSRMAYTIRLVQSSRFRTCVSAWVVHSWLDKSMIFIAGAIVSVAGTAFYGLPIIRGVVPHMFLLDLLLGILIGIAVYRESKVTIFIGIVTSACLVGNYVFYTMIVNDKSGNLYITSPLHAPSPYIWRVNERELMWKYVYAYYGKAGQMRLPRGQFGEQSMSPTEFIAHIQERTSDQPMGKHLDEVWIQFSPMDIVDTYANTRRYIPAFTPMKENRVDGETISQDFKLINEIFGMRRDGRLKDTAIVARPILYWSPMLFDQEYNYIYGYNGKIHELLTSLPLSQIDFRAVYYVKLSEVINALR